MTTEVMRQQIVNALRKGSPHLGKICDEAATLIEQLEAENERLVKALGDIQKSVAALSGLRAKTHAQTPSDAGISGYLCTGGAN